MKKIIREWKKLRNILKKLQKEFPDIVDEIRGSGSFQGFTLKNPFNTKIENLITNLIPIRTYREKNFFKKLLCASIINYLYHNKNTLTFGSYASDVLFKISPQIEVNHTDLEKFENDIINTLKIGSFNLIGNFIKYKFSK